MTALVVISSSFVIHVILKKNTNNLLIVYGSPFLLVTISAVYLRHKIMHVKAYIHELHQYGMDRSKLSKSQRLKELLTEQVKPTI